MISIAGLFGGPVTASIAAIVASAYRIHVGGVGAFTGVIVIFVSAGLGVAYYYLKRNRQEAMKPLYLYGFGVAVHVAMLLCMLTLPWSLAFKVLREISLPVILIYPVGTFLLATLLKDRASQIEAETALLKSEDRLSKSNKLLEDVLKHTHMLTVFMDPQFNFIWVNQAYAAADDREPSFFQGKNHFILYPHEENQNIFQRVVDTGESVFVDAKPFEYPDNLEKGTTYWDWSLIPVKDSSEKVTGLVLTLADVTERIQAEEKLRNSEELFRLVTQTAEIGITNTDLVNGKVVWDETCYKIHGYKPETPIALDFYIDKILHPDEKTIIQEYRSALDSTDSRYRTEYRIIRPDGSVRWLDEDHAIVRDEKGNAIRTYSAKIDITERKQLEEELRQSHKMESIGTIAGGIAHDFNNILYMILGNAELALDETPEWNPTHSNLQGAHSKKIDLNKRYATC